MLRISGAQRRRARMEPPIDWEIGRPLRMFRRARALIAGVAHSFWRATPLVGNARWRDARPGTRCRAGRRYDEAFGLSQGYDHRAL